MRYSEAKFCPQWVKAEDLSHFGWFGCLKQIQTLKQLDPPKPPPHKYQQSLICTLLSVYQSYSKHSLWSVAPQSLANRFPPVQLNLAHIKITFVNEPLAWLTDLSYQLCLFILSVMLAHLAYTTFPNKRKLYWHSFQPLFPSVTLSFLECSSPKLSLYLLECAKAAFLYRHIQFQAPF